MASDRDILKRQYPNSATWRERVNKMPDYQVSAIILRLKAQGKLK